MCKTECCVDFWERSKLKSRLCRWRFVALLLLLLILLWSFGLSLHSKKFNSPSSYIARVYITGFLFGNTELLRILEEIQDDAKVKAVLLHVDSPGGTFVGAESIYKTLRNVVKKKPVVTLIDGAAVSGGYMVALAANKIFAYDASVVGSIGVLLQTFEFTALAEKLGINLLSFKSSPLKATPNFFEKVTPEVNAAIQDVIYDMHDIFVSMVKERRASTIVADKVKQVCDGRIYTGRQAVENGLIDAIGAEEEALAWLHETYNFDAKLKVVDIDLEGQDDRLKLLRINNSGSGDDVVKQLLGHFKSSITSIFSYLWLQGLVL
ncbi:protease IV [Alphaproteobacteria bacterium]